MSEPAFTTAQREVLEPLFGLVGKLIGGTVYTQIRLAALEDLLRERRLVTEEELEEADRGATDRWRNGLMIDSLLDPDLATLLEEMRRRMRGEEPA
jgi:hypothetical protein